MKKSLLALAVLGAFAGAATAASSVTLYGRVDLMIGKGAGTTDKVMANGSGSRLGLRGAEDLGGGLSAIFNIEHRFDADTGAGQGIATRMWGARSLVGLKGGFGQVTLGREYTTSLLGSQLWADPWGWDTVVSGVRGAGLNQAITGGGIARVRNDSALTYNFAASGFTFGAQIAEATDTINNFQKKPFNMALGYAAGPLRVAFGYEKTGQVGAASAKWTTLNGSYNLGMVTLGAFYGKGTTAANNSHQSYMITAVAPVGQGQFRASFGKLRNKTAGVDAAKGIGLGYHYSLSKRTTVYADYVRNTALAADKTGYDFGIKHNF